MSRTDIVASVPSPSLVEFSTLDDANNQFGLATFRNLVKSCYGPNSRLKTIQHHSGGQVMLTSSSYDLLKSLPIRRPFLRLLVTAVTEHLRLFNDGGLFVAVLASELLSVCCCFNTDRLPRILCCDVNSIMLDWCNHFVSTSKECRIHVDISNMSQMMAVIRSIISTKPACSFTSRDISHVSGLILQAFLKTFPTSGHLRSTQQDIYYIDVPSQDTQNSRIIDGVLFQLPNDIPDKILPPGSRFTSNTSPLKVALFNISLAGDTGEVLEVRCEVSDGLTPMCVVTEQLFDIAQRLLDDGVSVLGCQKVIHPSIKKFLKKNGVLAIDRLSILNIAAVEKLSGIVN
ncbi:McKusick-Kaufman/Bardet-Biedl syndromes putative chaperonin-like [Anneissia japonica]|uniref:McKusick-Kaufman/Bardet-Biedl syndromes putative chaperonin-like n=1 Tax=Anneissia japonica TaxID=1529436 RepID=UPI001425765F|nr:McKusick-Kaufman/Bardet-Biedl syndromes putative chaperonin-like [Anneissia japonica]XP_033100539.1 McKusick-Kaufman/Bardet-Biedl syndromes putative chaperonin-like [Anneissia japonica]XP_033100540.1 McKusick-Kaufman/Bardet-Biedl syndromes putative chaperonin-like [Anneissia japonica]